MAYCTVEFSGREGMGTGGEVCTTAYLLSSAAEEFSSGRGSLGTTTTFSWFVVS